MICDLCVLEGCKLKLTICKKCKVPMVVHIEHKPNFSFEEKQLIQNIFQYRRIDWAIKCIKDHAHCHIE